MVLFSHSRNEVIYPTVEESELQGLTWAETLFSGNGQNGYYGTSSNNNNANHQVIFSIDLFFSI